MSDETPRRQLTVSVSAKGSAVKYAGVEVFCSLSLPLADELTVEEQFASMGDQARAALLKELNAAVQESAPYLRAYAHLADGKPLTEKERALFTGGGE